MKRKITSLILALAMLLSMMPAASLSVFAADGHTITVNTSAQTTFETKQGKQETIPLAGYFTDSAGHDLTYTLETTGLGLHTKVKEDTLYFTGSDAKTYSVEVKAACAEEASASVTFTFKVAEADAGDARQYGYDETPADSVTVYVTVSNDGIPLLGNDNTVLSHLKVEVPYFDLNNQGLSQFYRYHTENGSGSYVDNVVVERPTALHLYLYLLGKYYLGLTDEEITSGSAKIQKQEGNRGVSYFDRGGVPYKDNLKALYITGSPTSLYMSNFWGHDENLMYYRNHVYPLMSPGTGSTADYVLLSDGDTIDVAMFSNWSFWQSGAFACFDKDDYSLEPGGTLQFTTQKYDTKNVADGGSETIESITGLDVFVYDENWRQLDKVSPDETGGSDYSYTFDKAGTYYLLAMDPKAGTNDSCYAPATAKVKVAVNHTVTFSFPECFEGEATVAHGEDYTFKLAEPYFSDRANYELSVKQIGTMAPSTSANKDAIDNGDGTYTIQNVTGDLKITRKPKGRKLGFTVTANKDKKDLVCSLPTDEPEYKTEYAFNLQDIDSVSIYTVTVKVNGKPVPVEVDDSLADIGFLSYTVDAKHMTGDVEIYVEELDKSATISVTGVTLDKSALRLFVPGGEATLTATVIPSNAANQTVTWTSSDTTVAAVADGKVTAVGAGKATITVTTEDGGHTASCAVTVQEGEELTLYGRIYGSSVNSAFADLTGDGNGVEYTCLDVEKKSGLDVVKGVLDAKGYTYTVTANAVTSITSPDGVTLANGDETYGPESAWVGTVNGVGLGEMGMTSLAEYIVDNELTGFDGDEFVLTFTECPRGADGEHHDTNADSKCDTCGKVLVAEPSVPTRKADYPAETVATVQTGKAYLLSDLQTGKVFDPVEGQKLDYTNYYYQRSTDGGQTWSNKIGFPAATFGGTTIQLTETAEGTYIYRFYASHDGKNFSKDTWTLTLTVLDNPPMDFSFFVGKDYTGGYPVIKLYPVTTDSKGNESLGAELTNVTKGKLESNYQMFYANLSAGRYAYRAFAKNADTGEYDVALGGMTLDLPTDTNVDGGAGGGNNIYLQCNSFCVNSKKTDNTYFTADEYHVEVVCPIMKTSCVMGDAYVKGNYTYYPTVLYAAGNACLYNLYAYPDIEGYMFTQTINQTFRAGYSANAKSLSLNTAVTLTVTVPESADFGLYIQWNNFNTTKVEPIGSWTVNGDGTKTASYKISKRNGNYTWRMSDSTHVTQAGWLASQSGDASLTFAFAEDAATDRVSHDFSQLGSQTALRDEADLQVNLDPTGYKALTGTTRVRAYRHWQLINSDAGNIMVEPDFHWNVLSGNASFETVNGGNTKANWADVTPGTEDSILTVYYDSVDVNPGKYGTHGGLYPATQPNRLGVIVVGGSGVSHGTADAHVKYNMAPGATTTRSAEWDYNYDTWFYEASETAPALTFTVMGTGETTVEYAFVTAKADMTAVKTDFTAASAENGTYTVPLAGFRTLGAGKGGTVVIKMTDSTGVSYRLVRVAEVTITAENLSNPGEVIMPGDQVKLTWTGMYRAVNKISGIFNPTTFKPTYYSGETKYEGTLGQYQKMDNASVTVTIPKDVVFADGEATAKVALTGGHTFGSMYAASNPFAFLYTMTDTGVGTNFNAVTVTYYMNHYADAVVTVSRKVLYDTAFRVTDENGAAIEGVTVGLTGPDGTVAAGADGRYSLGYGKYSYVLSKDGYVLTRGSFTLGSADASKVVDGVLTISASMAKAGENAWDGKTLTEPAKDTDGAYLIGTAAELAWFAKNGGQGSARLTADIDLAGYDWTPMNKLYGTFDGQGHVIRNLYINSSSYPVGLFGYLQGGASVTRLGVTGDVTCTAKSNAQAGGIAGYMNDNSSITQCWSAVDVSSKKHGGGIAGYTSTGAVISDCYATGNIVSTAANECYLGGICGSGFSNTAGAALTNCYSTGTVLGSGGTASYVGGLSPDKTPAHYVNCYALADCVSGESPKYGITGLGTAKPAEELKTLAPTLGGWFTADVGGINGGYPILKWQIGLSYTPVESVTLDQTELELIVGKEATLTAAAAPADASDQTVTWTSSAPEIATVENGKITALAEGTATITVTTVDGGKTAQCQVTVKPIPTYSVTLPADFTGESTVQDGADYTFTAKDPAKYIYTVTAVMGGQTVEVIDNGDGTYTVKNVTGDLVIASTKVRRSEPITPVGPAKPDKPAEPEQPEKPELTAHAAFVTGYADGTVRPLNNITRSEVAAMLCRLLTESQKQNVPQAGKTFSDVPADAWYRENVLILAGMGVITGRADGTFAPAQNITRAEFAVMLTRFAGTTGEANSEVTFSDISGHWAESAIRAAAAQGWVKGMSDGTFRPDASITRAEAMAMLCRMLGCEPASAAELPENMPVFADNADTGAWYYLYVQEAACARNGE
ncbi:MAG: S-layer homology domain-containing protein [Clostridiaceae bacterium]|nr:S-layer homology domain-containing protein [Clostridiaceae bacterium]